MVSLAGTAGIVGYFPGSGIDIHGRVGCLFAAFGYLLGTGCICSMVGAAVTVLLTPFEFKFPKKNIFFQMASKKVSKRCSP